MNTHEISAERGCQFDPRTSKLDVDVLIASTIEAINPIVEKLMGLLTTNCCPHEHEFAVETALREALANAVVHGNHSDARKKVRVRVGCDSMRGILIAVKDQGEGFDPTMLSNPLIREHVTSDHGRGIFLIKRLMDETNFDDGGREIHMRKWAPTSHWRG
jgi:serine/threonine-protein kinase RsbW